MDQIKTIDRMVEENTGFARALAKSWHGTTGLEHDELYQTALIALGKAAVHFDYSKGFQFSTWAYKHINNDLKNYCSKAKRRPQTMSIDDDDSFMQIQDYSIDVESAVENSIIICEIKASCEAEEFLILWLRAVEGLSQKEVGKIIGKSQAQVCRIETRTKDRLKLEFSRYAN